MPSTVLLEHQWGHEEGNDGDAVLRKGGTQSVLSDHVTRKVNEISIGTQQACRIINRRQILKITKGVIRANNTDILKEFCGTVKLTHLWAWGIPTKLNWSKRKGTTGKVEPSA